MRTVVHLATVLYLTEGFQGIALQTHRKSECEIGCVLAQEDLIKTSTRPTLQYEDYAETNSRMQISKYNGSSISRQFWCAFSKTAWDSGGGLWLVDGSFR
jgi:hypothetical protein